MAGLIVAEESSKKRKRLPGAASGTQTSSRKRSKADTSDASRVATLEAQIQESQQYLNNIAVLLKISQSEVEDASQTFEATIALCRVFCRLISERRLASSKKATDNEKTVLKWLRARLKEYLDLLFKTLSQGGENDRRRTAMTLAMQVIKQEIAIAKGPQETVWRQSSFDGLCAAILEGSRDEVIAAAWLQKYAQPFDDVRHFFLRAAAVLLSGEDRNEYASGALNIILKMEIPTRPQLDKFAVERSVEQHEPIKLNSHRKLAQQVWLHILQSRLFKDQRKAILNTMTYTVVPWFPAPERLMDFLTDAFNVGGATSLLALSGMFYLMTEKNLDYPAFYTKLYALLDADVLHSKHRSRFFRLLNTFMSSTHLPANLVASFIKRLSRLALHAPPAGIVAVFPWIYNMFKAHPATTFMMHRVPRTDSERAEYEEHGAIDPFDEFESDPNLTGAIDSCVWELVSLQSHYHPNVASLAKILAEQFTKAHYNLEDFLDHSYGSLIDAELGKELKKTPVVEFEIPKNVFTDVTGEPMLEGLLARAIEME